MNLTRLSVTNPRAVFVVVAARLRREGEDVARGAALARLVDLRNLEVRVNVPLRYSGRVAVGDELSVFGFESQRQGRVRSIVPAVDARAQTYELRIDLIDDDGPAWSIGELVSVGVPMRAAATSLAVPRDALILRRDGAFVFRIMEDNTARRVAVKPGDGRGDLVAVNGDLSVGHRVVVRGAETLAEGAEVTILGEETAGSGALQFTN